MFYDPAEHPVAETIADLICVYVNSLIFSFLFTCIFQLNCSFVEHFVLAYFATMYVFTMKWWLSIDL